LFHWSPEWNWRQCPSAHGMEHSEPSTIVHGSPLVLNVGGVLFTTTPSTLEKAPFFEAMLRHHRLSEAADHRSPSHRSPSGSLGRSVDHHGHLFVDRSGFLFEYVLEYLRTGFWLLGDRGRNRTFLEALRAEALFYGLEGPVPEIFTAEVTEYFSIWSADDGHEIIFLISLEDDINDATAFQTSFVPESIASIRSPENASSQALSTSEKRPNDQNAHMAHKYPVQVKLAGGCVKTLYAEAVDGMSAADIAKKFIDQNCLKQGFVKPLEWVVGAIWENARSKYYPAHTREIYICARRQFQCTQPGLTFNREKIDW